MRVLIAEEELDVVEFLRTYFFRRGHEVFVAATAKEAMGWLQHSAADLALVDLELPREGGRVVIQAVVKRQFPTRIIGIGACRDSQTQRELVACGLSGCLFKPVFARDLDALFARPVWQGELSQASHGDSHPLPWKSRGMDGKEGKVGR